MKRGLGRGLASLISKQAEQTAKESGGFLRVRVDEIHVSDQPRKHFDEESLKELSESIKSLGVIQPLTVTRDSSGYKLLAGERRLRAAKLAGLTEVPVIVLEGLSEANRKAIQLVENLQRVDLTPIEEASGYQALIQNHKLTHEEVAALVGKSRAHVTNMLRLLNLEESVKEMISQGFLSVGHAKVLAPLSHVAQRSLAKKVISENMSVRALEEKVKELSAIEKGIMPNFDRARKKEMIVQQDQTETFDLSPKSAISRRLRRLEELFNCTANLQGQTLIFKFESASDLERVLTKLGA